MDLQGPEDRTIGSLVVTAPAVVGLVAPTVVAGARAEIVVLGGIVVAPEPD